MSIRLARSISEAKSLVDSLLMPGLCVDDSPNPTGRPPHRLTDVIYEGVLAAMTGRTHRQVVDIVTPSDMDGGRIVRHGALSKRLRKTDALTALADLVHGSAETARSEGCEAIDGPAELDPMELADVIRNAVGPFSPGASGTREGQASAIMCRACAHNMVVFGDALDPPTNPLPQLRSDIAEAAIDVARHEAAANKLQAKLDEINEQLAASRQVQAATETELEHETERRHAEREALDTLVFGSHFKRGLLAYDFDEILRVRTAVALYDHSRRWALEEDYAEPTVLDPVAGIFGCIWVEGMDASTVIESALAVHLVECRKSVDPDLVDDARLTEPLGRVWLDLHGATNLESVTVTGHPNRSLVASIARALRAIMDNPRMFDGLKADWSGREPVNPDDPSPVEAEEVGPQPAAVAPAVVVAVPVAEPVEDPRSAPNDARETPVPTLTPARPQMTEGEALRKHEGIVRKMARQYGVGDDDGYQAGRIGVLRALRGFEPERGNKFSTYAVWIIRSELQREMRDRHPLGMRAALVREWGRVRRERQKNPDATDGEIAEASGVSPTRLRVLEGIPALAVASIDAPAGGQSDGRPMAETVGDGSDLESEVLKVSEWEEMEAAIDTLDERLATIVRLRATGLSRREVGERVGLSRARVGQLEVLAHGELRRTLA